MNLVVALALIVAILYVSMFVHELGHAITGWSNGFLISSFGVGWGRPLCVMRWRSTRIYFCSRRFLQGFTFGVPEEIYPLRRQMIVFLLGGTLANAVTAGLVLALWWILGRHLTWLLVAGVWNAYLSIINIVPFRFGAGKFRYFSDGLLIVRYLRGERHEHVQAIRHIEGFKEHLEAIGDAFALHFFKLTAALAWIALARPEKAEQLCVEAKALPVDGSSFCGSFAAATRASVALALGRITESESLMAEAEQAFHALGNKGGIFLVLSLRADLHHAKNETEQAILILNALSEDPFLARRPDLQNYLLSTRLTYHAALADPDVDKLREEYEAVPKQRRSLVGDFYAYRALGQLYLRREQQERAINAYRLALTAASELYCSVPAAEDKEQFLQMQKPFLLEASECLRQQTMSASSDTFEQQGFFTAAKAALIERTNPEVDQEIQALFPPPALEKRPRAGTAVEQHRPVVWILMFLNLGVLLTSVAGLVQKQGAVTHHPQNYKWVLWLLLLCSGTGLSSCLLSFVAAGPGWTRRFKGKAALVLMMVPTLVVLLMTAGFIIWSIVAGP